SSGEALFIQARFVPEVDEAGAVRSVIAVLRDLTELEQKDAALRESESFLKLAQKSAGMGIWQLDLENDISRWSPESFRIYGRDPAMPSPGYEEWLSMVHEKDRPAVMEMTRGVLDG